MNTLVVALRTTVLTLALTGLAYPLLVTGLAQVLFPSRANGSLVEDERHQVVGSELIGQAFTQPHYLQGRPSAAGDSGYDPKASGGSNLAPTAQKLRDRFVADVARLQHANPHAPGPVPTELVSASGSGLDPEISPEAAAWQVPRIAEARDVAASRVREVIEAHLEGRDLGLLGEPRVNVLAVNLDLDRRFGAVAK